MKKFVTLVVLVAALLVGAVVLANYVPWRAAYADCGSCQ